MRLIKIVPPLLALLLMCLGGWRLSQYITSKHRAFQSREYAQAHPLLSWLGPNQSETQNGYTLLAVQDAAQTFQSQWANGGGSYQNGGDTSLRGDTAFWFRMDDPPSGTPSYASSRTTSDANFFTVTAHASDGDTFPLDWELNSSQPEPLFHATLPAGYPDTYHWLDLTVADRQGHTATWRISHLPPTQHLIPSPVRVQSTYKSGGVMLTASAWRQRDPYNKPHVMLAMYRMRGTIYPYQHQWEVAFLGHQWEWGLPNAPRPFGVSTEGFSDTGAFDNGGTPIEEGNPWTPLPYVSRNHYVRLNCALRQFDTLTETVTFRNVPMKPNKAGALLLAPPHPLSLKTPSGITVTLSDASQTGPEYGFGKDTIGYVLDSDPHVFAAALPASPLWRKYRKSLGISAYADPPAGFQQAGSESSSQAGSRTATISFLRGPRPSRNVFPALTVSVVQRVDLKAIPITFTLPIGQHP